MVKIKGERRKAERKETKAGRRYKGELRGNAKRRSVRKRGSKRRQEHARG